MVYDELNRLLSSDNLRRMTIVLSDESVVTGGTVFDVSRSGIMFYGGESSREELSAPLESIAEIRERERIVFRTKKRIHKIYPRG